MAWSPTIWFREGWQYFKGARVEASKVTWPTQKEYTGGTIGVLVVVAVIAVVLGLVDFGLTQILQWILG